LKLLLDEMWSPTIAEQLRFRGYDVSAVAERPDLRHGLDALVFIAAQGEGRAIVTENVPDFRRLAAMALADRRPHAGLVFTSNRRFPRHDASTIGRLVTALDGLLSQDRDLTDLEWWLE
jgi:predicted nuclease of predicted toxin-antitoxin system